MSAGLILPWFDRPGVLDRFIAKIDTLAEFEKCWDWTAGIGAGGYGVFKLGKNVTAQAHRISYALCWGEPGDLLVCHRCNRPRCCNPYHMKLGTHHDNMNDDGVTGYPVLSPLPLLSGAGA